MTFVIGTFGAADGDGFKPDSAGAAGAPDGCGAV